MYLSCLYIENYRSIIVGKNNSGKSNIIKAIDLLLGERSPTWHKSDNISENDFYQGKTNNEIFIWCELKKEHDEQLNYGEM
jgi:putative ATP-dependent endonuclease of the OLD family